MARFFLPSMSHDAAAAERAYQALRDHAEVCTGSVPRERRIHEIECRLQGHDCCLRVGESDTADGRTVAAILQLGRDTYSVHHLPIGAGEVDAPLLLRRNDVYAVADFD